jgi:hypothetical protein
MVTVDVGSQAGLSVGMPVDIVRPATQPVVHPLTGENLGAPAVQLARGTVSKVSPRAASVRLEGAPLLAVRPGDMVRFQTAEDEMVRERDQVVANEQRNQQEHQQLRNDVSELTRSVRDVQGRMKSLDVAIAKLDRLEQALRAQLRGIGSDISSMKADIKKLQAQVLNWAPEQIPVVGLNRPAEVKATGETEVPKPVPRHGAGTAAEGPAEAAPTPARGTQMSPEELRTMMQEVAFDVVQRERTLNAPRATGVAPAAHVAGSAGESAAPVTPAATQSAYEPRPAGHEPVPVAAETPGTSAAEARSVETPHPETTAAAEESTTPATEPFWSKTWFIAVMAGVGVAALAAYVYSRVAGKSREDEEHEADDVADEADDVDDVQVEEEDDIVVEETS